MRVRYVLTGALVGILCTLGATSVFGASAAKQPSFAGAFFAIGTGKKEVSPVTGKKGSGDRDARLGFTAVIDGDQFCWAVVAKNVDGTPAGLHVHKGGPSRNGPIVIPLDPPQDIDPGAKSGCEQIAPALANDMRKHPSRYYVNIHSTTFGGGAARGQLFWKTK
jgi:hypothetical protein